MDNFVSKNEKFPELEVFQIALSSMDDYFRRRETEIRLSDKNSEQKKRELADLKARKEKANGIRNAITSAMNEYESAVRLSNVYESKKLQLLISAMQDKKVVKTFEKERVEIEKRKIKAKEDLVKALQSQELGWLQTTYIATKSYEPEGYEMTEVERALGGRNLKDIMKQTHIEPTKVANQFVSNSEYKGIHNANPEIRVSTDINEVHDYTNITPMSTGGTLLYVEDAELKNLTEISQLDEVTKEARTAESVATIQPTIPQIDIILKEKKGLSNSEFKSLKVTKEKYHELGLLDLEYERVNTVLQMLEHNPAYAKTNSLLKQYEIKLLQQRRERLTKVMALSEEAKVSEYSSQIERKERVELAEKGMKYWEQKLQMNPNDEYAKQKLEEFKEIFLNGGMEEETVSKTM